MSAPARILNFALLRMSAYNFFLKLLILKAGGHDGIGRTLHS